MITKLTIRGIEFKERFLKSTLFIGGLCLVTLMAAMIFTLGIGAWPALIEIGPHFITHSDWNPVFHQYGALPLIYGTVVVALLALVIALPLALSVALMTTIIIRHQKIKRSLNSILDVLSGIPSVVFGLWALVTIVPIVRLIQQAYDMPPYGVSILSAVITLAIMIIPYAAALIREVIKTIPKTLIDTTYALGATQMDLIKTVVLPYSKSGIIAGGILALGRALGETMAVSMLIGNVTQIPSGILDQGNTISSLLANEFSEAVDPLNHSSLMVLALAIFGVTTGMSILGRRMIRWFQKKN
jgi:phosphate transport system permease protein